MNYRGNFPPIPLFNMIRPVMRHKFMLHILLSIGRFDTKLELYVGHDVKQWFANAKLVKSPENISEEEVYGIVCRHYLEQLLFLPSGTRTIDRNLCASFTYL